MRKKIPIISGVAIFIMVLTANIQYAIEGYGIGENSLHAEVLAQTSSGGGSGSGGSGGSTNNCSTSGGNTSGGCKEICSARVDCSPGLGDSYVSCKGYNSRYSCQTNWVKLWVKCDGKKHRCCVAC